MEEKRFTKRDRSTISSIAEDEVRDAARRNKEIDMRKIQNIVKDVYGCFIDEEIYNLILDGIHQVDRDYLRPTGVDLN